MTNIWNSFFHQIIFIIISYYVAFYYLLLFIPFSICFMDFFFWFSDDYDDVQPLPEDFPPPPPEIRYQLTPN